MLQDKVRNIVEKALKEFSLDGALYSIEYPTHFSHGDFATNVAMVLAKSVSKNPKVLAEEIVEKILSFKDPLVEKVEVAGPGFINFFLSREAFSEQINVALSDQYFGEAHVFDGKKVLVEHSSPNLFKPFHIGHLMNNAIGESIVRLAKFSGARVSAISYPSDVSLGIGKAVAIVCEDTEKNGGKFPFSEMGSMKEQLAYLGDCYVRGTTRYDEDPLFAAQVKEITELLYARTPGIIFDTYLACKEINLAYFKEVTASLGTSFDDYIYESETGVVGEKLVREHIGDIFTESDGAVIFEGEKEGLHTRVFINKEGRPTYEAKDVGLLSLKFSRFSPDCSVFVTDHEQKNYFEVVSTAAGKIHLEWKEKTVHRTHGRMAFVGQKISSRLGGVPLASAIVDTLAEDVKERAQLSPEDIHAIAVGAIKFSILRVAEGKNMNFDPETSLSFEGDSGPYLQYTAVRARSVVRKAKEEGIVPSTQKMGEEILSLEKHLLRFPEIVSRSIFEWAPHHLASYLLTLAQEYNSWYGNTKIINPEDAVSSYRVALSSLVGNVIERGLWLLGIAVPEKM